MSDIGKPERATQDRVVALFHEELGYRCLGDWTDWVAIANVLSDMNTEVIGLVTKVAKARQLEQGMMQELLTGRIRLV
jgi:hypothetical protein